MTPKVANARLADRDRLAAQRLLGPGAILSGWDVNDRRPVVLACGPLFIQPLQTYLERTLPDTEDVGALTAAHLADQSTAVSGATNDFFVFGTAFGQREEGVVGLFTSEVSFILEAPG